MASRAGAAAKNQVGQVKNFMQSETGQKIINGIGIFGASVAGVAYVTAHTFLADKYQEVVQHYKHGFPVKVSPALVNRTQEVAKDMGLKERFAAGILPFHVFGFEPLIIGSFKVTTGVRLGLPKYLAYNESGDIERMDIQIEQQPVKWHTEEGSSFAQSLLLSDSAKKFIIAQQLSMADSNYVYVNGGLIGGSILGYRTLTHYLNRKTLGFLRPTSYRTFLYICCGTFIYGLWSGISDLYDKRLQQNGDARAGGISLEYARGGVEYYAKKLQRNMALRELMGPSGEKMFTALGNDEQFLRQRYVPITRRKENLEKIVQQHLQNSKDSNNNDSQT